MRKTMFCAMVLVFMVSFFIEARAGVLLDGVSMDKYYDTWKMAKYEFYQFHVTNSGNGIVNLNNKSVLFPIVPAMCFGGVKAGSAGATWEKIDGNVLDKENGGKTFNITAISDIGIKNVVTVETSSGAATSNCKVESVNAPDAMTYWYEAAILNYGKLASIPFTATLETGETVSGDLCTDFKPVRNIRTLELKVGKTFQIEFEGLRVEIIPRNNETVAAGIKMYPVIKGDKLLPGGSFSYGIKLKLAQ